MTLRCVRCKRALTATKHVTVKTSSGVNAFGPVCAKRLGLSNHAELRTRISMTRRRVTVDESQVELFEVTD